MSDISALLFEFVPVKGVAEVINEGHETLILFIRPPHSSRTLKVRVDVLDAEEI